MKKLNFGIFRSYVILQYIYSFSSSRRQLSLKTN